MPFVVAGLVVVFLLTLLDLLLTFGVIRRLRWHTELQAGQGTLVPTQDPTVPVGSSPGDFAATALDDRPVSLDLMATGTGRTIVAFFAPDCSACGSGIAEFVLGVPDIEGDAYAIVMSDPADAEAASMIAKVERVARVVVEPVGGVVATAFGVHGVPAMCLLDESAVVLASGRSLDELVVPAPA